MAKTKMSDICKNGNKLKVKKINLSDPDVKKMFKAVAEEQKRIRKQSEININDLRDIVINI